MSNPGVFLNRFVCFIVPAVFLLAMPFAVAEGSSPSPKDTFFDDTVLNSARNDIMRMGREELNSFTNWMAECVDEFDENPVIQHPCSVAREKYLIEFSSDRAIDRLIHALNLEVGLIQTGERLGQRADSKVMLRLLNIEDAFSDTATLRFSMLRK